MQVEAEAAEYVPTRQLEQTDAEATAYLPATQAPVVVDRPVVAQYEPAGDDVHEVEPVEAWYLPVEQLIQDEEDEAEYLPTRQFEHTIAAAEEYCPAVHVPVTADRPVVAQ